MQDNSSDLLGTVLIPTYIGHLHYVKRLLKSLKDSGDEHLSIDLVISFDECRFFDDLAKEYGCNLVYIEDLVYRYIGRKIKASNLLFAVGKFKFQALKKLLGCLYAKTELILILDSESIVKSNLRSLFAAGTENTYVLFSERNWKGPSLSKTVSEETNSLLGITGNLWFFESFNWLYSKLIVENLFEKLASNKGKGWIFRSEPVFECQLYFQYVYNSESRERYLFEPIKKILSKKMGQDRYLDFIRNFNNSPYEPCGYFEYIASFLTKEEYLNLISSEDVIERLRFLRIEPATIYPLAEIINYRLKSKNYYGNAAMNRGELIEGKIAILVSGDFKNTNEVSLIRDFLTTIEADIFVAQTSNYLNSFIMETLRPVNINLNYDNVQMQGEISLKLASLVNKQERRLKRGRDVGTYAMFTKINMAFKDMVNYEKKTGCSYNIVVRLRPGILSPVRLCEILQDTIEKCGIKENCVYVPDRFWSQGCNDQFFFAKRKTFEELVSGLDGEDYLKAEFLNPENFLASTILKKHIEPIPVNFPYILTRGEILYLDNISDRFREQEINFWSAKIECKPWQGASKYLEKIQTNAVTKNLRIPEDRILNISFKGREYELIHLKNANGSFVLVSEYKSPIIFIHRLGLFSKQMLPFLMRLGMFLPYFKSNQIDKIYFKDGGLLIEYNGGVLKGLELYDFTAPGYSWYFYFLVRGINRGVRACIRFPRSVIASVGVKTKSSLKRLFKIISLLR